VPQLAGLLGPAGLCSFAAKALGLPPSAALLSIPQPRRCAPLRRLRRLSTAKWTNK